MAADPPIGSAHIRGMSKQPANKARPPPKSRDLLRVQVLVLILQLLIPLYYYHSTAVGGYDASLRADQFGHEPPPITTTNDEGKRSELRTQDGNKGASTKNNVDVVGTFNNVPISYVPPSSSGGLHSTAHCIGEMFVGRTWIHRSCEYRNICFDTVEKDFVVFRSPTEKSLADALNKHKMVQNGLLTVSSVLNTTVSLGGINLNWAEKDQNALEWAPIVRNEELTEGYYLLPEGTILLPFHSFAAMNIGHLFWDDFLPIYTLIDMFEMIPDMEILMPVRYTLKNRERALWATCDLRNQTLLDCKRMFKKVMHLIGVDSKIMRSTEDSILNITDGSQVKSRYICSSKGAAGMGALNDHGLKTHGWEKRDYDYSYNTGRGSLFNRFRNFMMSNIGIDPTKPVSTEPPYIITFSPNNSRDSDRRIRYHKQEAALKEALKDEISRGEVVIRSVQFDAKEIEEQVQVVAESAIMVGTCGGGASTNMFLPKGSGMILYYPDKPSARVHNYPARLDWDYLNNAGYARVHWLPISQKDSPEDVDLFVKLVLNEIETISHH